VINGVVLIGQKAHKKIKGNFFFRPTMSKVIKKRYIYKKNMVTKLMISSVTAFHINGILAAYSLGFNAVE
jgi:hypothetical protein